MRLFVGIDIPEDLRARMVEYVEKMRSVAPDVKWVKPETLHVTLKFIGETQKLDEIQSVLSQVESPAFEIAFREIGFFTPRQPRVFWVGVHASQALPDLAQKVDEATAQVGIKKEEKEYRPHLTLARAGSGDPHEKGRGHSRLVALRDRIAKEPPPEFGRMLAAEFILYQSQLSPKGARYTKLQRYELKQ